MSADDKTEQDANIEQPKSRRKLLGGKVPPNWDIQRHYDPQHMTELLYRSKELSDEAFSDLIDDVGYRAARIVLRGKALQGDIRAIDLYMRTVKEERKERAQAKLAGPQGRPAQHHAGPDHGQRQAKPEQAGPPLAEEQHGAQTDPQRRRIGHQRGIGGPTQGNARRPQAHVCGE